MERITAAQLRDMQATKGEKHAAGRNSKPVEVDGIRFPSKKEAKRWADLCLMQKAGEIHDLRRQVDIALLGAHGAIKTLTGKVMVYRADFTYNLPDETLVVEDAKGHPSPVYLIKKAILAAQGIIVREV